MIATSENHPDPDAHETPNGKGSDTPGGGWKVIEALKAAGFAVQIATCRGGWRVSVIVGPDPVSMVAATMEEAACQVGFLVLPNAGQQQPRAGKDA